MAPMCSRRAFATAASALAVLAAGRHAHAEPPGDLTELTATQALEQIEASTIGAADYASALAQRAEAAAGLNALLSTRWR